MPTKIIFFGTSKFAVPALEALKNAGYEITAVITNPDEPVGRTKILTPPPVKVVAQKLGIKILQPKTLKDRGYLESLDPNLYTLNPDLGIVAAYGKVIPKEILDLPKLGLVNIHPSLLPKYRGPTPIQSAILNGEKETGATLIKVDEEVDCGQIIAVSEKVEIGNKNYSKLHDELSKLGAEFLIKTLRGFLDGKIIPQEQEHSQATFTKKFTRDDAKINWNKTAEEIDRQIRALNPEPGVWTVWNGKMLKILEAEVTGEEGGQIGQVFQKEKKIIVGTGENSIVLKTVQLEGKKAVSAEDFTRGNGDFIGAVLE